MKKSVDSGGSSGTAAMAASALAAVAASSSSTLAAPNTHLQVRRSSAPGSNSASAEGHVSSTAGNSSSSAGAGLLFVGGVRSNSSASQIGVYHPTSAQQPSPSSGTATAASGANAASASSSDKSGSPRHKTSNDAWVCPNDRQLALRAKLV